MTPEETGRAVETLGILPDRFDVMLQRIFNGNPTDELRQFARVTLSALEEVEREVLYRVYRLGGGKHQTYEQIAQGMSGGLVDRDAVRTIRKRAQRKLRHGVNRQYDETYAPKKRSLVGIDPREIRVDEADFSVRTHNCLVRSGIMTLGELATKTKEELFNIRNFGRKLFLEVNEKLEHFGLQPIADL